MQICLCCVGNATFIHWQEQGCACVCEIDRKKRSQLLMHTDQAVGHFFCVAMVVRVTYNAMKSSTGHRRQSVHCVTSLHYTHPHVHTPVHTSLCDRHHRSFYGVRCRHKDVTISYRCPHQRHRHNSFFSTDSYRLLFRLKPCQPMNTYPLWVSHLIGLERNTVDSARKRMGGTRNLPIYLCYRSVPRARTRMTKDQYSYHPCCKPCVIFHPAEARTCKVYTRVHLPR